MWPSLSTAPLPSLPLPALPSDNERSFTTGYDDFHFDPIPQENQNQPPEQSSPDLAPSLNQNDALLNFQQPPTYGFTLLDYSLRRTSVITMNARLHGMFFMADTPPTPGLFPQNAPPELTCYRRNLFQVTGSITLPRGLRYILTDTGERIPIVSQELAVSATESVEGHAVKLISVPWKTPANNTPPIPEDKTEKEPNTIPLDIMSNQDMDADYATFPIAWKRLQFRIATANNGRRKELQQHFVARLNLIATLTTGMKVSIAEIKSSAIVVRGRSPRNFQQRRELAVGEKATARKGMGSPSPSLSRRTTGSETNPKSPLKREHSSGDNTFAYHKVNATNSPTPSNTNFPTSNNWGRSASGSGASSAPTHPTPTFKTPTLPSSKSVSPPSAPQPLSLTDDYSTKASDSKRVKSQRPLKSPRITNTSRPHPYKHPSLPLPTLPSTRTLLSNTQKIKLPEVADKADLYYEYVPLPNGDMMQPVDAVYRPHAVHHTISTTAGGPGTNRKYFSQDAI